MTSNRGVAYIKRDEVFACPTRTFGNSTPRRIPVFPIQNGWSYSSTPRRIRVPGSCILSATRRAAPGRIFAEPDGPAEWKATPA